MAAKLWCCGRSDLMTTIIDFLTAFLIGLTSGVHCFGMCGGLVGALTLGLPPTSDHPLVARLPYLLAYNAGRIVSYVTAGVLAGGIGAWVAYLVSVHRAQLGLQIFAGLFMILLGLYLAGWWPILSRLEQAGGILWRRIEPLGRWWLPVRTPAQAFGIGLVWGWLPCGLVYSVLVWAIGAGEAHQQLQVHALRHPTDVIGDERIRGGIGGVRAPPSGAPTCWGVGNSVRGL